MSASTPAASAPSPAPAPVSVGFIQQRSLSSPSNSPSSSSLSSTPSFAQSRVKPAHVARYESMYYVFTLVIVVIAIFAAWVQLLNGGVSGGQVSDSEQNTSAVCAQRCVASTSDVFWHAFFIPAIIAVVFFTVGKILFLYASHHVRANAGTTAAGDAVLPVEDGNGAGAGDGEGDGDGHAAAPSKWALGASNVAGSAVVRLKETGWMKITLILVLFAFPPAVVYCITAAIPGISVSKFSSMTTKTACNAAGHKWCSGAAPTSGAVWICFAIIVVLILGLWVGVRHHKAAKMTVKDIEKKNLCEQKLSTAGDNVSRLKSLISDTSVDKDCKQKAMSRLRNAGLSGQRAQAAEDIRRGAQALTATDDDEDGGDDDTVGDDDVDTEFMVRD